MAQHYLAKCDFQYTSTDPRDLISLNPTFRFSGTTGFDASSLADNIITAWTSWHVAGAATPLRVRIYDLEGAKPVYPAAEKLTSAWGTALNTNVPRELALCLSFAHDHFRPRQMGRLYVPWAFRNTTSSGMGTRPTNAQVDDFATLAPVLAAVGGPNIDWGVWSRVEHAFHQASIYFVDNEWDTVRRRGLRGTYRKAGTTSG